MGAPQWIAAAFLALSGCNAIYQAAQRRDGPASVGTVVVIAGWVAVLWWGGFWSGGTQ